MSLQEYEGIIEDVVIDLSEIVNEKSIGINTYCFEEGADETIAGEAVEIMAFANELIEKFKRLKEGGINFGSFKIFVKKLASSLNIKYEEGGSNKKDNRGQNNDRGLETIQETSKENIQKKNSKNSYQDKVKQEANAFKQAGGGGLMEEDENEDEDIRLPNRLDEKFDYNYDTIKEEKKVDNPFESNEYGGLHELSEDSEEDEDEKVGLQKYQQQLEDEDEDEEVEEKEEIITEDQKIQIVNNNKEALGDPKAVAVMDDFFSKPDPAESKRNNALFGK